MPEISWIQMRRLQQFFVQSIHDHPSFPIVISHGDSWFAYPIYANIIDQLDEMTQHRMSLLRLEGTGDELIGILDVGGLAALKTQMQHHPPDVLLLSAGGNDIVGPELLTFVAERTSPFDPVTALATVALANRFDAMKKAYERLIAARDQVAPHCLIVTHGYARPIPSGTKAHYLGFSSGPWIKPFLEHLKYTDPIEQRAIVDELMSRFNKLVDSFAGPKFVKVDLRHVISEDEWSNEIHPTRHGFEDAARELLMQLKALLPGKF
ncbi:MAG: hypothetical protein WB973_01130 [Thermoanaerobaculia bacterium]